MCKRLRCQYKYYTCLHDDRLIPNSKMVTRINMQVNQPSYQLGDMRVKN